MNKKKINEIWLQNTKQTLQNVCDKSHKVQNAKKAVWRYAVINANRK